MRDDIKRASATWTRKSGRAPKRVIENRHRFEHWYRSNQVYFISARCRDRFPAFASEDAKAVFWDRFEHHTQRLLFQPWITSLLDNHYHTVGYCAEGENIGEMMRCIHGSVAKLVNDLLEARRCRFWRDEVGHDYFDGCLRDEVQFRRAYRYVMLQSVRHGICRDWRLYPHTHVRVELEDALAFAVERRAFLEGVPYKRYEHRDLRGPAT